MAFVVLFCASLILYCIEKSFVVGYNMPRISQTMPKQSKYLSLKAKAKSGGSFGSKGRDEVFFCSECGGEHAKWVGRCNFCKSWNTVKEFRSPRAEPLAPMDIRAAASAAGKTRNSNTGNTSTKVSLAPTRPIPGSSKTDAAPVLQRASWLGTGNGDNNMVAMNTINLNFNKQTLPIYSKELSRVLGGGVVKGSVVLIAGEPGIGKSTLLLQLAASIVNDADGQVVYLSGEENDEQIASRAQRLGIDGTATENIYMICDIDVDNAITNILNMESTPELIIVDSIQTMRTEASTSSMGTVTQTRESAARFVQLAKATGSCILLVGHVTKSGDVAGPRVLEHMVDTVLYLEGSDRGEYRLIRSMKNRFGSTSEVGVLSMTERGMIDVTNPSDLFMTANVVTEGVEGSAVAVLLEGSRPILAEIQCLVSVASPRSNAKRMSDGFPVQRLLLICAVIEKRLKLQLWNKDVYVNVAGGLRVNEPSSDLAVAITVISSLLDKRVKAGIAFIGEVGLGGELRGGKGLEIRIREAAKLGFRTVVVPKGTYGKSSLSQSAGKIKVLPCGSLREVMKVALQPGESSRAPSSTSIKKPTMSIKEEEGEEEEEERKDVVYEAPKITSQAALDAMRGIDPLDSYEDADDLQLEFSDEELL